MMYNMYALARNAWKYTDRDHRYDKTQQLEHHFLAPDTVNEMFNALDIIAEATGKALLQQNKKKGNLLTEGRNLLNSSPEKAAALTIEAEGFENSKRSTLLAKVDKAYPLFRRMIAYYASSSFLALIEKLEIKNYQTLLSYLPAKPKRSEWENIGGQLMRSIDVEKLKSDIEKKIINSWEQVHAYYKKMSDAYLMHKFEHAYACLLALYGEKSLSPQRLKQLLKDHIETKTWITEAIHQSRKKDYTNPFRKMVYASTAEMDAVQGKLKDNGFINTQYEELEAETKKIQQLQRSFFR
ncbi:MAG: DUF4954 domain-containing protein, partial [Chitinophagaceae bacterium]